MEAQLIICPDCKGKGKVRDWAFTVFTSGLGALLGADMDKCERCDGLGKLYVKYKVEKS